MMKSYPTYKESGIEWLGQIPAHWEIHKLKNCLQERKEKGHPNEPVLCATQSRGVIPQDMYDNRVVVVNKDFDKLKLVKRGDFVISLRSFQGGIEYAYYQGIISAAYTVLTPRVKEYSAYFQQLFKSYGFVQLLQTCVTGIREGQNINYAMLSKCFIPMPSLDEQRQIVAYLDDKSKKINDRICKIERELQALSELKQAEIAAAVTRGLDPDVPMKESGVEWLGQIPAHWKVEPLGKHMIQRNVKVSDQEYEPLSVSKNGITLQLETACKTDHGENRKLVKKGDFVVNSRSDRKGSCGISNMDGSVSLINIVLEPIDGIHMFYHYLFRSHNYVEEFYRNGRGIVADLWTTRYVEMRNISIPIPPIQEQLQIVDCIEDRICKVDSYIAKLKDEITYLQEYKQRLISDVVTGKIDVRGIEIPNEE